MTQNQGEQVNTMPEDEYFPSGEYGDPVVRTRQDIDLIPEETEIRRMVDPNGTLPKVGVHVYEREDSPGYFRREKFVVMLDDEIEGMGDLITIFEGGSVGVTKKKMYFDGITLDKTSLGDKRGFSDTPHRERPKGMGLAAYLIAIETARKRGMAFESQDGELSIGSNKVWQILVERGVAKIVEEPVFHDYGYVVKVRAKYRVELN